MIGAWFSRRRLAWVGATVAGVLAVSQVFPVDRSNPPVRQEPVWDSPTTRTYAQRACFDCHSHETRWPWYSYVAPLSWVIVHHVNEGREALNFSAYEPGDGKKAADEVSEGEMPLWNYLVLHSAARLSAEEKTQFIAGLKATLGTRAKPPPGSRSDDREHEDHPHK